MICQAYKKNGECKCTSPSKNYSFYCGRHKSTDLSKAIDAHFQETLNNFNNFTNMNPTPEQHFELATLYYKYENERKEKENAYIKIYINDQYQMWGLIRENNKYYLKMKTDCTIAYIQNLLSTAHN